MSVHDEAIKHIICNSVFNDFEIAKNVGVDEIDVINIRANMKKVHGGML